MQLSPEEESEVRSCLAAIETEERKKERKKERKEGRIRKEGKGPEGKGRKIDTKSQRN